MGNYISINFKTICQGENIIVVIADKWFSTYDVYVNGVKVKQNVKEESCVAVKVKPGQNNVIFSIQVTDSDNKYKSDIKEVKYVYNPITILLHTNIQQAIRQLKEKIHQSEVEGVAINVGEKGAGKSSFTGSLRLVNDLPYSADIGALSGHMTKDVKLYKLNSKIKMLDVFGCTINLQRDSYHDSFLNALIQGRLLSGVNYCNKKELDRNDCNPTSNVNLIPKCFILVINGPSLLLTPSDSIRQIKKVNDKLLDKGYTPLIVVTRLDKLVDCEHKEYLEANCLEHPNVKMLCNYFDDILGVKTSGDLCFVTNYGQSEENNSVVANYFLLNAFTKIISKMEGNKHKVAENTVSTGNDAREMGTWKEIE